MRKPVFGVYYQVRLEISAIASRGIILSRQQQQRRGSDAQADLRLCSSHMTQTGFLMTWLNYFNASLININIEPIKMLFLSFA